MKIILALFFSGFVFSAKAGIDIKLLRRLLNESPKNEKTAEFFFEQTKNFNETNGALLLGFKAMSEFMLCNHVSNVFSKLSHFNTGKRLLEEVIKKDSKNVELIYIRFTVQTNVPALLAYSGKKGSNIGLRLVAMRRGLKLTNHGLFRRSDGKMLAGKTEREIYEALGRSYKEPWKR